MALLAQELVLFHERITHASRPLVFYDDDADGLTSYLLIHKKNPDAIGIRCGRGPEVDGEFARKIHENQPDLVVIVDKPRVSDAFFSAYTTPTLWLDHHDPSAYQRRGHVTYLNPRIHDDADDRPTSFWVWKSLGGPVWLAAVGTTADWHDSMLEELRAHHPELLAGARGVQGALYRSPLGELVRMFNFSLKGSSKHVQGCVNTLKKIDSPKELLTASTPRGRFIHKHVKPILAEYEEQLRIAQQTRAQQGVYVHVFGPYKNSLVAEVANELLISRKTPIIIVGRRIGGEVKFSMRSHARDLPPIVEKALQGVEGYGGGHREACGGSIVERDWDRFVTQVREQV